MANVGEAGGSRRSRGRAWVPPIVAAAGLTLWLAGCGGGGSRPSSSGAPPATSAASTTAAPTTVAGAAPQAMSVTPDTGLADGQKVKVTAKGFHAHETGLIVIECADKGNATGQGDCDLAAIAPATADAIGALSTSYAVHKGPFGTNKIVCSAAQKCELSVTQESPSPTENATADIAFAG